MKTYGLTAREKDLLAAAIEYDLFHQVEGEKEATVYVGGPDGLEVRYQPFAYEGEHYCNALELLTQAQVEALQQQFPVDMNAWEDHTKAQCREAKEGIARLLPDALAVSDWAAAVLL
jgi:hypothetical protein